MSSVLNFIKNLPESPADNVVNDVNYIRRSSALVNEALQKGSDIMQLANGDILVTETKIVTYKYEWSREKGKFERAASGTRSRRKQRKSSARSGKSSPKQSETHKEEKRETVIA